MLTDVCQLTNNPRCNVCNVKQCVCMCVCDQTDQGEKPSLRRARKKKVGDGYGESFSFQVSASPKHANTLTQSPLHRPPSSALIQPTHKDSRVHEGHPHISLPVSSLVCLCSLSTTLPSLAHSHTFPSFFSLRLL